ncbi:MAG: hypothetical protein IJS32_01950 [Kiritimatiellae bacterium]|nr:hypothetical protein [Kiritimatiellia bacterium]
MMNKGQFTSGTGTAANLRRWQGHTKRERCKVHVSPHIVAAVSRIVPRGERRRFIESAIVAGLRERTERELAEARERAGVLAGA